MDHSGTRHVKKHDCFKNSTPDPRFPKKKTFKYHCNINSLCSNISVIFFCTTTFLAIAPEAEAITFLRADLSGKQGVGVGVEALKRPLRVNLLHGFASEKTYRKGTIHIMNHKIHHPRAGARHGRTSPIPFLMTRQEVETTNYRAAQQPAIINGPFLSILSQNAVSRLCLCVRDRTLHQAAISEGAGWIGF